MGHYENPIHAAKPEQCNDPVIVLAQLINSIQSIVSRNLSAFDDDVIASVLIANVPTERDGSL
jgi:metal-dependent amidase/aminoacylase/carboxypeptidase family protein